jgi:hypothetical protein
MKEFPRRGFLALALGAMNGLALLLDRQVWWESHHGSASALLTP